MKIIIAVVKMQLIKLLAELTYLKWRPSARTVFISIPPILLKMMARCPPSTEQRERNRGQSEGSGPGQNRYLQDASGSDPQHDADVSCLSFSLVLPHR